MLDIGNNKRILYNSWWKYNEPQGINQSDKIQNVLYFLNLPILAHDKHYASSLHF